MPITIITPEKVAFEGEVESLVVPSYDGQWGILPGHAPMLAQLKPGVVQMRLGEQVDLLSVSGGFVEVCHNRVSLFAETAELAQEINEERARQAAERAKAALHELSGDPLSVVDAHAALERALARMRVFELARKRSGYKKPPVH